MPDSQPKTLTCPACGAPLEFDGRSATVLCKFCHNVSVIPGVQPSQASAPNLALDEIRQLAERGNLIEAIKQYRELYGVGLKEAKYAVQALQAGRLAEKAEDVSALESQQVHSALNEIRSLLGSGNKIEAIRKYRESFDVSLARAKFAVEQLEAGKSIRPGAEFPPRQAIAQAQPANETGSRISCVIVAAVLLFVGGILIFGLSQSGGPFSPRLFANGPAILLPSESDTSPDVAATLYDPDKEVYVIGRIDAANGKLLWKSVPLLKGSYTDAIIQGDGLVYAAHGMDLLAFNQSDGSPAWQVSMSDKIFSRDSLTFTDGRVIAMGLDQTLQSFEADTGRLAWSRQIGGFDRVIRLIDKSLLVIDYIDDDNNFGMIFLDPLDGHEQRVLTPLCQYSEYSSDKLRPDSGLVYDEHEKAFYLMFGPFINCIQRLDLASGQITWGVTIEDSFSFSSNGFQGLLTDTSLYFGEENQLIAMNKANGEIKILLDEEGYEFLPLAAEADQLVVRVRRTRGTERFELWGLEPTTGKRVWQIDLGKAKPVDPPNAMSGLVDESDYAWTWQSLPEGLLWLEFQAQPNQIAFKTIDSAGYTSGEHTIALKLGDSDFYSVPKVIGWQGRVVYFILDSKIYAIDTATSKIKFDY